LPDLHSSEMTIVVNHLTNIVKISEGFVCKIMLICHPVTQGHGVGLGGVPPRTLSKILSLRFL
jgi:hypothetical protein